MSKISMEIIRESFEQKYPGRFDLLEELLTDKELNVLKPITILNVAYSKMGLQKENSSFKREYKQLWIWLKKWRIKKVAAKEIRKVEIEENQKITIGGFRFTNPEAIKNKPQSSIRFLD